MVAQRTETLSIFSGKTIEPKDQKPTLRQRWANFWGPKGTSEEMSTGKIYQRVMSSNIFK